MSCILCSIAYADTGVYDCVEWLVAMGDDIGVYQANRLYETNSVPNGPSGFSTGDYLIAEFKLQETLRGKPPTAFSRHYMQLPQKYRQQIAESYGFHAGDTYIFFFANEERRNEKKPWGKRRYDTGFSMWDYIWLERPQGVGNGAAIDHNGQVLANKKEILKIVKASLKLPRASTDNFRVLDFLRMTEASSQTEPWTMKTMSWMGLVIPQCLYSPTSLDSERTEAMFNMLNQIERQIPEVKLLGLNAGAPKPGHHAGVENVLSGFRFRTNDTDHSDFVVTITRYASTNDAQMALEQAPHLRPATPQPKETYKGATLYRYTSGGSAVICQDETYLIEINSTSEGGSAYTMKALDVVLAEVSSLTPDLK